MRLILFFLIFAGLIIGGALYVILLTPNVPANLDNGTFVIKRGMILGQIADSLKARGLIDDSQQLVWAGKILRWEDQIKAGKYAIDPGASNLDLLESFRSGKSIQVKLTLPEGKTSEDFAIILERELSIDRQKFLALVEDSSFASRFEIAANRLEGYLFPNTYFFEWGTSPEQVIRRLVAEFHDQVHDSLRRQIEASPMTLHEVVTLASIIEGEAVIDDEREIIAAVYLNRIELGMLLQADPTIQYIVPGPPRRLLHRDLALDSPYNTYLYPGLPPGPVNNPGIRSIEAAVNPADVDYLYFVAQGDGSHVFSRTLNQHLRAKRNFDRARARVRREQRQKERGQQ